jgi:hypothetical protein
MFSNVEKESANVELKFVGARIKSRGKMITQRNPAHEDSD